MSSTLLKTDNISILIIWFIALAMGLFAFKKGLFALGIKEGWNMLGSIFIRLLGAFFIAGFAKVLIPTDIVVNWFGQNSGWKGIILAWLAGIFTPGGPFVSFPILAVLLAKGASIASVFTFLTSWSLVGLLRIITWELPFFGFKLVSFRVLLSVWVPLIIGVLTKIFYHYYDKNVN